MRSLLRWLPLVASTLAALSCGPEADEPRTPRALTRLWLDVPPAEERWPAGGDTAAEPVFESDFRGEATWYGGVSSVETALAWEPLEPRGGELRLDADRRAWEGTRPWIVLAPLSVLGGDALSVTVRVRADASVPEEEVVAAVVEFKEPFDPTATLDLEAANAIFDPDRHAVHELRGTLGTASMELRTDFVAEPLTRTAWLLFVVPQDREKSIARTVESVRVQRQPIVAHVAAGGQLPDLTPLPEGASDAAVRVTLDREERQGLLALPPARFSWELPPLAAPRRLDVALGVVPRARREAGAVRFRVEVAGRTEAGERFDDVLLDEVLSAPADSLAPAWNDRSLTLPSCPVGPLSLVLATEPVGDDPPVAVLGHPTVSAPIGEDRPNVVLISLDTLRPDRLGSYGGDGELTPRLDALAAEGLRFTDAYSTSTYTLPSHASLMTGQYPAFHGAVDVWDAIDAEHSPLLAALLARAGYVTAAFTGGGYVSTHFGFGHGFDRYSHNDPVWAYDTFRGQMLIDTVSWTRTPVEEGLLRRYGSGSVAEWIEARAGGAPFFLFLHTYIVHNYAPDLVDLERHGLLGLDGFQRAFNHKDRTRFNAGELGLRSQVHGQYMPYYDATIGMADRFVGEVLDALERAGLAEDTLVVVTSDHGEEFGEHDFFGHGETLYDGNARIPLLARLPGPAAGREARVVEDPVSLVDLAPWILRTVGLEPDQRMAVVAPLGPDRDDPPGRELLFVELDNHRYRTSAVREGPLKLHVRLGRDGVDWDTEAVELFDLQADPGELVDLADDRPDDTERLRARLERYHALAGAGRRADRGEDLDDLPPEIRNELQALGYLGGDEDP